MKKIAHNILTIVVLLATNFLLVQAPAVAATPATQQTQAGIDDSSLSANWAGYVADTAASYNSVGSTWTIPTPSDVSARGMSTDATWVGIGGVKSKDLIQAGTQAVIQNGDIEYQAWYEILPDYQEIAPLTVHGGDSVTVSLTNVGGSNWHLSIKDSTTGGDYEKNISYDSSFSSAEWIEEMPVIENGRSMSYLPLDNFGTVQFTNGFTTADGTWESIGAAGAHELTMTSGNAALATPSALADNAFSITRGASDAPQQTIPQQLAVSSSGFTTGFSRHHQRSLTSSSATPPSDTGSGYSLSLGGSSGQGFIVITIH